MSCQFVSAVLLVWACLLNSPAAASDADFQHVWVHYDYMVFPRGWTAAGGTTFPDGLSMAPSREAIDKVVKAFAAQGLILHIDPVHNAIPGHQVIFPDFDSSWTNPSPACVGPDAASFLALKKQYFRPAGNHPWHYAVFGFNVGLPDTSIDGSLCPRDRFGAQVDPTSTGFSELPGFNFIVAFGYAVDSGTPPDDTTVGGTFMHELGHNFGLEHGGVVAFEELMNYKPNYISVMNYAYQAGIPYAATLGSTTPIGRRLDYSRAALAPLNEYDLNEFVGVNAGTTDIVINSNLISPGCNVPGLPFRYAPAQGPIDWNCDGNLEAHASADIDDNGAANRTLHGFDDWSWVKQQLQIPPDVIDRLPKRLVH